jgi:hypothetical protein
MGGCFLATLKIFPSSGVKVGQAYWLCGLVSFPVHLLAIQMDLYYSFCMFRKTNKTWLPFVQLHATRRTGNFFGQVYEKLSISSETSILNFLAQNSLSHV